MKKCIITILDNVHAKITGIDGTTARECEKKLSYLVPYAFHMPAYKLGRWDGKVKMFKKENGRTYNNHLEQLVPILVKNGYEIDIDDHRPTNTIKPVLVTEDIFADHTWPKNHILEDQPIMLRDDQAESANIFLNSRYGLMKLTTSYGKTMLSAAISKALEPFGRTLTIVPSKSLVEQTIEDFHNVGMDVGGIHGERKELGHQHTVTTWQSLKSIISDDDPDKLEEIRRDLVLVIADECHQAKDATELKDMLCGPLKEIPYRLGLTGTVPKEDFESQAIIASLGPLIHSVSAKTLQDKGIIAKCEVANIITQETEMFKEYATEMAYLSNHEERLGFISEAIEAMRETGNTLILVNSIKSGKLLNEMIKDSVFVYGQTKQKDRSKTYKGVHNQENAVIIATYAVAAVGINIPRIFNMVLIEPGKSFVRVIQSIGRGIRIAKDKNFARIFDLSSTCKFSKKHLKTRKEYYADAEYPYKDYTGNYNESLNNILSVLESDKGKNTNG